MTTRFEWEDGWEAKAWHFRSSLNPLGDAVREATDDIGRRAKALAEHEAQRWEDTTKTTKSLLKKNYKEEKLRFYRAKAMAYSLRAYVNTLKFIMVAAGDENYGAVVSYHARGLEIEFGGKDPKMELGKTGQYLEYPAFSFLRRALGGG